MKINGRKLNKSETEKRIQAALLPGWRLVGINWKKGGKVRAADLHGRSANTYAPGTTPRPSH
jgi:hypothetical protein